MKSNRHRVRELVLQGLYEWLVSGNDPRAVRDNVVESPGGVPRGETGHFDEFWRAVIADFPEQEARLGPFLDRPFAAVTPIEKAVLAIGAYELACRPEVPYRVAINEAVTLAKAYGGTDGHKFVNGVLDRLAGALRAEEVAAGGGRRGGNAVVT